jgi:hypothetical protein
VTTPVLTLQLTPNDQGRYPVSLTTPTRVVAGTIAVADVAAAREWAAREMGEWGARDGEGKTTKGAAW